jgi:hypothetical protein
MCIILFNIRYIDLLVKYKIEFLGFSKSVLVMYKVRVLASLCFQQLPPHKAYKYRLKKNPVIWMHHENVPLNRINKHIRFHNFFVRLHGDKTYNSFVCGNIT